MDHLFLNHVLPLGWLPLTQSARQDGFLPVYRRLARDGHSFIDRDLGSLAPDMYWRHGRGRCDLFVQISQAWELIRSTAEYARPCWKSAPKSCRTLNDLTPERLLSYSPNIEDLVPMDSVLGVVGVSTKFPLWLDRADWLVALPQILPNPLRLKMPVLLRNPARLMRAGYQMLCNEWTTYGPGRRQTSEALAVIGLGALGLFPRVRCAVCFRLAMPGGSRCAWHSQTKVARLTDSRSHSAISASSRTANDVMRVLRWPRTYFVTDRGEDPRIEEKTVAGIVWGLNVDDNCFNLEGLRKGLIGGRFPHVCALLPQNFCDLSDARACAVLRRCIDPREWVVSYWFIRVVAAEKWLEVAADLSPGRVHMKPSKENRVRVEQARIWIGQGLAKKEVATRLGVSPSHLSQLLRRFPDDQGLREADGE